MSPFNDLDLDITGRNGKWRVGTEDIIAIGAVLVAVIIALGIVFQKVPVNDASIGVLGFSAVGGVIAQIIKAKRGKAAAEAKNAAKHKKH